MSDRYSAGQFAMTLRLPLRALALAGIILMLPEHAAAQSGSYTLVELAGGAAGGGPASDVSNAGVVVGYRSSGGGYVWTPNGGFQLIGGDSTLIGKFPCFGYFPKQLAVNAGGMIVGRGGETSCGISSLGAAVWSAESGYVFIGGGDSGAAARSVNSTGTVVGLYRGNGQVPSIWRSSTGLQQLPGFNPNGGSDAFDVNDAEVVVGRCGGGTCGAGTSAFIWTEAGGIVALPRVHLAAGHEALAINNNGGVVGRFHATSTTPVGVFFWSAATGTIDLAAPTAGVVESSTSTTPGMWLRRSFRRLEETAFHISTAPAFGRT